MIFKFIKVMVFSIVGTFFQSTGICLNSYEFLINAFVKFNNAHFMIINKFGIVCAICLLFYNRFFPFKFYKDEERRM